jgi:hypothetical protein
MLRLRPRPEPDGEVLAIITAASEQLLRPAVMADEANGAKANAWRYSGRWFAAHQVQRRMRPY